MTDSRSTVLQFSPPKKKHEPQSTDPSEYLLLKPFSKSPSLNICVPVAGKTGVTLLSIQNIDDCPSRLYFEIPAEKKLIIQPKFVVIQPRSVEVFEVIAEEPKESFRATVKVFAPDIKYYRGGQFYVSVDVPKPAEIKRKSRLQPKPQIVKPAVTVPKEFKFQPSREERKKNRTITFHEEDTENSRPTIPFPEEKFSEATPDLENIRRQTRVLKHQINRDQTYVVPPPIVQTDLKDPLTFLLHTLGTDRSLEKVSAAVLKYAEFVKNDATSSVSEEQRQTMNRILVSQQHLIDENNVVPLKDFLRAKLSSNSSIERNEKPENSTEAQLPEKPKASLLATMTTSSPKNKLTPETTQEFEHHHEAETTLLASDSLSVAPQGLDSLHTSVVQPPDVSAIFPINLNF